MQLKNVLLTMAVAIAGAEAHGSLAHHANHARSHAQLHKRDDFVRTVGPSSKTTGSTDPVVSATSDTDNAASPAVSDAGEVPYKAFCNGAVSRRATTEEIAYKGNTGTADDYGCNMMEIPSSLSSQYKYTLEIKNVASEAYAFVCFNKIGKTGGINGFFKGMGETVTQLLAAGESTTIAFEPNTQGGCAFGPGSVPTTTEGCYAGTWLEFDFENASNNGWSGADCSSLVSADTNNAIYGCRVCDEGEKTCSTIYNDGTGENAYTKGTNALDGVGLNMPPGNATISLQVGYSR